jgi:aldehyde dehydrogenase (NAD(P)+)
MSDLSVELTAPNGRKYTQPTGLFINNEWVAGSKGDKIKTINPTDESEITSVHAAEPEDVDKAVAAARAALKGPWKKFSPSARGDLLMKFYNLIQREKELLATVETWDNGGWERRLCLGREMQERSTGLTLLQESLTWHHYTKMSP